MNVSGDAIFAIFTSLLHIIGFIIYNYQIAKQTSKPNIVSWFLWSFIVILNFTTYSIVSGDWVKSLLPTISGLAVIITFLWTLRRGTISTLNKFDNVVVVAGLIAVVVWWQLKSPLYANLILQIAIIIGFIPTYVSVVSNPNNENPIPWGIWATAYALGTIVVLLRWNGHYIDIIYPLVTGFMAHGAVALLSLRKCVFPLPEGED